MNVRPPDTNWGVVWRLVNPRPSSPSLLPPQQYSESPVVTPHVCSSPASRSTKDWPPDTNTGLAELVVLLLPSSPWAL